MRQTLSREMAVTRADFLRLLPVAVGGAGFVEEHNAFQHGDGNRLWRIVLEQIPELQLGIVRLDRHLVSFEFNDYSNKDIASFMARFDLYFRRGGG